MWFNLRKDKTIINVSSMKNRVIYIFYTNTDPGMAKNSLLLNKDDTESFKCIEQSTLIF